MQQTPSAAESAARELLELRRRMTPHPPAPLPLPHERHAFALRLLKLCSLSAPVYSPGSHSRDPAGGVSRPKSVASTVAPIARECAEAALSVLDELSFLPGNGGAVENGSANGRSANGRSANGRSANGSAGASADSVVAIGRRMVRRVVKAVIQRQRVEARLYWGQCERLLGGVMGRVRAAGEGEEDPELVDLADLYERARLLVGAMEAPAVLFRDP